jgi:small subunit ribosomal protein S8
MTDEKEFSALFHESMTDPIADMLIRIKNAQIVGQPAVRLPFSRLKFNLAQILEKEGFLGKIEKKGKDIHKYIKIDLKYNNNSPAVSDVKRISKPSQRIYLKKEMVKPVKQGYGIAIISTSKGLMTNNEARKQKLGGELMCEIW